MLPTLIRPGGVSMNKPYLTNASAFKEQCENCIHRTRHE